MDEEGKYQDLMHGINKGQRQFTCYLNYATRGGLEFLL